MRRWIALAAIAIGCGEVPVFECDFDFECDKDTVCTDDGYCARHDATCPSMLRYDTSAGELGGTCVAPDGV